MQFKDKILKVNTTNFDDLALEIFQYQAFENKIYRQYLDFRKINPNNIQRITEIPFLPISIFKSHKVTTRGCEGHRFFESSGTTGSTNSRHYFDDTLLYDELSVRTFEQHFGPLASYKILALLPSYLEKGNSSLVHMVSHFMQFAHHSRFYKNQFEELFKDLKNTDKSQKIILWGVAYALLDFIDLHKDEILDLNLDLTIIETGGMKGRRKELIRHELHHILSSGLGVSKIGSEYGMTEMFSQAYSLGDGIFEPSPTLKILFREPTDPFEIQETSHRSSAGVNVIDLGNLHSCSFIETQDLGKSLSGGRFEILGRFDNSDVRGCNLLMA